MTDAATVPRETGPALLTFDNSFVRELAGLYRRWQATPVDEPELLVLNDALAVELGADPEALASPEGVAVLAGNVVPAGADPVAQAYSGHQFGGFSPVLGDGRALLLGEVVDPDGKRWDLQLKGSGRTPFARGGDGKAAVGPMLREHLLGEAMAALGVPTSRMLAVVATGETVRREGPLPGAVLARVAASHLRIGTFQFAATQGEPGLVRRLADYAIARHHPTAADAENPYVALLEQVTETQAALVARWMLVGFIHGVMNTDNMTISGETIDYGPCAFMDAFDPATVFSSIDHGGRYAYGNQAQITQWNLARLAETLLELLAPDAAPGAQAATDPDSANGPDTDAAIAVAMEVLESFPDRFARHWRNGLAAKLGYRTTDRAASGLLAPADNGLPGDPADPAALGDPADPRALADLPDPGVLDDLPGVLAAGRVDFTSFFRSLADAVRAGDDAPVQALFAEPETFTTWARRWRAQLPVDRMSVDDIAAAMDAVNPRYIPRNHLVESALEAATAGDLGPYHRLLEVLTHPYDERPGLDAFAGPAPADFGPYQTFCGT